MSSKRKAEEAGSIPEVKKPRVCAQSLLDFSDDVLLTILSYLSSPNLLSVSEVCQRLYGIVGDDSLWKKVDTLENPLPPSRFKRMLKFVNTKTLSIRIGGKPSLAETVTPDILAIVALKCPNLEEISLEGCKIDAERICISDFPSQVRKLALRNCDIVNISPKTSYFFQAEKHFPSIQALDLTNASWLSNHSLQAICKVPTLKQINFQGCCQLGECFVYTALSTRFGFRNVTLIDLRDTLIGDSEVPCFGRLPNITHLYLGRTENGKNLTPPLGYESSGRITDRGVVSMCISELEAGKRGTLRVLSLLRSDITDRSLQKLAAAFPLEKLDIRGSNHLTPEGIESYRLLRPTCQLEF